jgi:type I restriction enzyme M protein
VANERKTEELVRQLLRDKGYYDAKNDVLVEEQSSEIEAVKSALKKASKTGGGGKGSPEFIISSPSTPDFIIVFECKADTKNHKSKNVDNPVGYAVDGVLHYSKYLSPEFNVISVAVSGQSKSELKISTFLQIKGEASTRPMINPAKKEITEVLSWNEFMNLVELLGDVQKKRESDLVQFSRNIHDFMRDHAKLTESDKPLLVSGTLIALQNKAFSKSFDQYKPEDLQREWFKVIQQELNNAEIPKAKKDQIAQPYSNISVLPELGRGNKKFPKGVLYELIKDLNEKVAPFVRVYHNYDVVGQFYGEFLKYTGGDKKGLGIVLTPRHITDLFAELANVTPDSKVLDTCAGTGGFLISAMHRMIKQCSTTTQEKKVKESGLVGVENLPNMFALAASNMILRGDGKANLYQGSCFDEKIIEKIVAHQCDVAFLNPPYSQSDQDFHELRFVLQALKMLQKNGTAIAIVPMSCAITPNPVREEILKHHTLEAVMSMPDDLFYPVGTVTCIMVFTANVPHSVSNRKTWFGYFKNDGFVKVKHRGRVDTHGTWESIQKQWTTSFRNREVVEGFSILQQVDHEDEWCAEAYIETDYSNLASDLFVRSIQDYRAYLLQKPISNDHQDINGNKLGWRYFTFDELFELKKGKRLTKANMKSGSVPFVSSTDSNNGISSYIGQAAIHQANTITVNYDGSVAEAYYQPEAFYALDSVNVLYPKFDLDPLVGLFIATIIKNEKYRFNYGRKWHLERMSKSRIKLPVDATGQLDLNWIHDFMEKLPGANSIS